MELRCACDIILAKSMFFILSEKEMAGHKDSYNP